MRFVIKSNRKQMDVVEFIVGENRTKTVYITKYLPQTGLSLQINSSSKSINAIHFLKLI